MKQKACINRECQRVRFIGISVLIFENLWEKLSWQKALISNVRENETSKKTMKFINDQFGS